MNLQNSRVVIITGGTGGLGQALAAHYLHAGDHVVVTGRSDVKLDQLKSSFHKHQHLHTYSLDITSNDAVRAFCAWIQVRFGRCDLLFNNAGSAVFKPFLEMSLEELEQTMRTNVDGLLFVTRAFLPMMLAANSGHIVNIASLAGRVASAKAAVYGASKAAVIRFSEGLRQELLGTGVRVTCILPGPIDTPFLDAADPSGRYREKVRSFLLSSEEVAKFIAHTVKTNKTEAAVPFRLHFLSVLYTLLPSTIKTWAAPFMNRK